MSSAYLFGSWILVTAIISPPHAIMYSLVIVFLIIKKTRFGDKVKEQVKLFFSTVKIFFEIIIHATGYCLAVAYIGYLLYWILYRIPLKGIEIILNFLFPY